jgi:hypothetical protein
VIVPDVNVLVRAHREDAPAHEAARAWLEIGTLPGSRASAGGSRRSASRTGRSGARGLGPGVAAVPQASGTATIASISTPAPFGRAATPTAARAGGSAPSKKAA